MKKALHFNDLLSPMRLMCEYQNVFVRDNKLASIISEAFLELKYPTDDYFFCNETQEYEDLCQGCYNLVSSPRQQILGLKEIRA